MSRPNVLSKYASTIVYTYKLGNQPHLVGICLKNYGLMEDSGEMVATTVMLADSAREVAKNLIDMADEADRKNKEAVA